MQALLKRLGAGHVDPREAARALMLSVGTPIIALALFLLLWSMVAARIQTSISVSRIAPTKSRWVPAPRPGNNMRQSDTGSPASNRRLFS